MERHQVEELINKHKDAVYKQMVRVCNNRDDAEDALGASILAALTSYKSMRSELTFRSWLSTVAHRICSKMRDKTVFNIIEAGILEEFPDDSQPEAFELETIKSHIKRTVDDLPETLRDAYLLCEIEERSLEDVAKSLKISVAAAKSRVHRARQFVRNQLDQYISIYE